mmetsp:Transcript_9445/g.26496  ORF Transcript_9445/g.26496 Transcript_9445/m.26496 type:complete len:323 (-) Transcript_9445:771-1739(-)
MCFLNHSANVRAWSPRKMSSSDSMSRSGFLATTMQTTNSASMSRVACSLGRPSIEESLWFTSTCRIFWSSSLRTGVFSTNESLRTPPSTWMPASSSVRAAHAAPRFASSRSAKREGFGRFGGGAKPFRERLRWRGPRGVPSVSAAAGASLAPPAGTGEGCPAARRLWHEDSEEDRELLVAGASSRGPWRPPSPAPGPLELPPTALRRFPGRAERLLLRAVLPRLFGRGEASASLLRRCGGFWTSTRWCAMSGMYTVRNSSPLCEYGSALVQMRTCRSPPFAWMSWSSFSGWRMRLPLSRSINGTTFTFSPRRSSALVSTVYG